MISEPRIIVALSGGKSSFWCANWALQNYDRDDVVLYFNDTKWEHPDLYRFLEDIGKYLNHEITVDSDGRSPEELFHYHRALANNRMPFCSRILKADRLQKYFKDGDVLIFGIGYDEQHRADRLVDRYADIADKSHKWPTIIFPLIDNQVTDIQIDDFMLISGIKQPILYDLGFQHNNCSGGCVRAGKRQWKLLYDKLPEVYAERERVEEEIRTELGKDVHFFRDETLREFRLRIESGNLSKFYDEPDDTNKTECIGVCDLLA